MADRIELQKGTSFSYRTIDLILQHPEEYIAGCDIGNAVTEGYRDWETGDFSKTQALLGDPNLRMIQGGLDLVNYSTSEGQYRELDDTRKVAIERGMFSAILAKTTAIQPSVKNKPSVKERIRIWRNV
jgi:hypothetical protein